MDLLIDTNHYTNTVKSSNKKEDLMYENSPPIQQKMNTKKNEIKTSKSKLKSSSFSFTNCKCFISIWSIWYCLFVLSLHAFLIRNHILKIIVLFKSYLSIIRKLKIGTINYSISNYDYVISLLDYEETVKYVQESSNSTHRLDVNDLNNINILKNELYFEITSRICMLFVSVSFLLFFLITILRKCDNYSNDNFKFGRDFFNEKFGSQNRTHKLAINDMNEDTDEQQETINVIQSSSSSISSLTSTNDSTTTSKKKCCSKEKACSPIKNILNILWSHFLPISSFSHLISVLALIITDLIFQNNFKKILNYKSCTNNKDLTNQELNYLLLNFNLTNNFYNEYQQGNLTQCLLTNFFTYLLKPINQNTNLIYDTNFLLEQIDLYKLELASITIAMLTMFTRYGSTFWFTNKTLSFLITFIGLIASIEQLFQLYSFIYISNQIEFSYLYKEIKRVLFLHTATTTPTSSSSKIDLIINQSTLIDSIDVLMSASSPTWTSLSEMISTDSNKLIYKLIDMKLDTQQNTDLTLLIRNKFTLLFLFIILSIFVYLSATPAYVFSYLKYKERFQIEESLFMRSINKTIKNKLQSMDINEEPSFVLDNEKLIIEQPQNPTCCFNYCPHLIATIQLIIICACKLPYCYDYIIYFNNLKDFGIMLNIIIEIMHTIILLFIWLTLTLRTDWNMHLRTEYSICHWTYHVKINEIKLKKIIKKHKEKLSFEINNTAIKSAAATVSSSGLPVLQQEYSNSHYDNHSNVPFRTNNKSNSVYSNNHYKHKSMFVDDKYFQNNLMNNVTTNLDMIDSTSDCLLNSETIYRNEIRKSIRNIMQQKKVNQTSNNNSSANINQAALSYRLKSYISSNNSSNLNNSSKRLCSSGIYLTSSIPFNNTNANNNGSVNSNNSGVKIPIITCTNENNVSSRPILYLENKNSSNEYESRV
jgi:hypothetical protein